MGGTDIPKEVKTQILQEFNSYPTKTLDGLWGCFYNNLRSILECEGGNQYKQAHNKGSERAENEGSAVDLEVDAKLVRRCKNKFYRLRRPDSYYFQLKEV